MKNKKGYFSLEKKRSWKGFLFVLPIVLGLIVIYIPSIIQSITYSFSSIQVSKVGYVLTNVGLVNYERAFFIDPNFRVILLNSLRNMILDVPVIIMFSFFVATILNQKFKGNNLAKVIFFLPVIIATGIISEAESNNMIIGMYSQGSKLDLGAAQGVLNYEQLKALLYASSIHPTIVDVVVGAIDKIYIVITSSGVQLLIFISGLHSIPVSMFEAAKVEGATGWETFWKISFPYISPLIFLNVIYTIIDSFLSYRNGAVVYIRGTMQSADLYAYSSALSWIYVVIIMVFIALVWMIINKFIVYQD